jgi:hypothetical protein
MAKRKVDLTKIDQDWVLEDVAAKVRGGAIASQSSRDAALYTQMKVLPHGRRVLLSCGLHGAASFVVTSGVNPNGNPSKVYPSATSERVMARQKVRLTPGYTVRVTGLFAPSGPTQTAVVDGMGNYNEDTAVAGLRCTVVITGVLGSATKTITLVPKWSIAQYKSLPTDLWAALQTMSKTFLFDELKTPGWSERVTAEVTVTALGGLRPVEISVVEEPYFPAQDENYRECTVSMARPSKETEYAVTALGYPDATYSGSQQAAKTARDYRQVCGPLLAYWSCWSEGVASISATEGTGASSTGTTYKDVLSAITTWGSSNPGWSMSSGGTAQALEQSGPLELRGVNACVPVICRAYMRSGNASATATVCFQTEDYALRELATSSATYVWVEGLAWLRCGVHQTDPANLQVFIKSSSISFAAQVAYLSVEYAGNYEVTP